MATGLGTGYAPLAPGTVASALTAGALWLASPARPALLLTLAVVVLGGTWAAHVAERRLGEKDPGVIVIDEVAGMIVSVALLPLTVPVLVAAFACFRLFDIVKPFPAGRSQRCPGGVGVVLDDLIAGLYALGVVVAARALLGWP